MSAYHYFLFLFNKCDNTLTCTDYLYYLQKTFSLQVITLCTLIIMFRLGIKYELVWKIKKLFLAQLISSHPIDYPTCENFTYGPALSNIWTDQ